MKNMRVDQLKIGVVVLSTSLIVSALRVSFDHGSSRLFAHYNCQVEKVNILSLE